MRMAISRQRFERHCEARWIETLPLGIGRSTCDGFRGLQLLRFGRASVRGAWRLRSERRRPRWLPAEDRLTGVRLLQSCRNAYAQARRQLRVGSARRLRRRRRNCAASHVAERRSAQPSFVPETKPCRSPALRFQHASQESRAAWRPTLKVLEAKLAPGH